MSLILGAKVLAHDACVALLDQGTPRFIHEAERFTRLKNGCDSDLFVLFESLRMAGIRPGDLDAIAVPFDPALVPARLAATADYYGDHPDLESHQRASRWRLPAFRNVLIAAGLPAERVIPVRHHLAHCAAVFYPSTFQEAAILSVDGCGEHETTVLAHGGPEGITVLDHLVFPHSLGRLYSEVTRWLGWGWGEEGKTMALAAYGRPWQRVRFESFFRLAPDGGFRLIAAGAMADAVRGALGPARRPDQPLSEYHQDVAATLQELLEEALLALAGRLHRETGCENLLVTGGVGLNSVANGRLLEAGPFRQIQALPQANDAGTALGAALALYHDRPGKPRWTMTHAYWGADIDADNAPVVAADHGLTVGTGADVVEAVADHLAAGRIVGWAQGRAEVGPRALGHRSILGNPLLCDMKDRVNLRVKNRENWRPFAPSVLEEDFATYFEGTPPLPYMIVVARVKPEWRAPLAAICHVDGTARVQTVSAADSPRYHRLISAFKARTGVGVLLNTSLNGRGEPVVQTAAQAIELYLRTDMDAIAVGPHLIDDKAGARPPHAFYPGRYAVHRLKGRVLVLAPDGLTPGTRSFLGYLANNTDLDISLHLRGDPDDLPPRLRDRNLPFRSIAESAASHDTILYLITDLIWRAMLDPDTADHVVARGTRAFLALGRQVFWADRSSALADMGHLPAFLDLQARAMAAS